MTSALWTTLLRIAEEQVPQISGTALWRACGGAGTKLVESGLLSRTPSTSAIPLESTHDSDDDAFEDGYEHLLIPGLSQAPVKRRTNDPHVYRLSIDRLLRAIAQSLGVKRPFLTAELLPDRLWRLGGLTAGSREPIFFGARRVFHGDNFAKVRAELSSMLGQRPFVVLTTAPARPAVLLPPGLRLASLHDCAWLAADGISLDLERLAEVARTAFAATNQSTGFWHSPTYDVVRLRGLVFPLSPNRRQAVRKLHEASKTDDPWVAAKDLIEGRMVDAFKSLKPNWRLLIESDQKGKYRLNL
jgi:hypothetical protein